MKYLALALLMMFAVSARAQTRFLIGGSGGEIYSNVFGSVDARVELPLGSRFEIDGDGQISPHFDVNSYQISLLKKVGLGSGFGYSYALTGRWWFIKNLSLDGIVQTSEYSVTRTRKKEYFSKFGVTYRTYMLGTPTRFGFHYIREFANGLMSNGDESNDLNGGDFIIDGRVGCTWNLCVRVIGEMQAGVVKNQGNPQCDGTLNPRMITCPRSSTLAGGGSLSVYLEFPRRKNHEYDLF